jgi:hypothetical protein
VGYVVEKVALGQVSSEYFSFPCRLFSFQQMLHNHLSSGADTIGHLMADISGGLSLTLPHKNFKRKTQKQERNRWDHSHFVHHHGVLDRQTGPTLGGFVDLHFTTSQDVFNRHVVILEIDSLAMTF